MVLLYASAGASAPALTDIRGSLAYAWRTVGGAGGELRRMALPIGGVALFLAARLMALQALSLLVVPLYWTLPRILDLQATLPAAVVEGAHPICPHRSGEGTLSSTGRREPMPLLSFAGCIAACCRVETIEAMLMVNAQQQVTESKHVQ